MRVLLAEDDAILGDGLRTGLRQLGFSVDWVRDGLAAERELLAGEYAAAVIDLGLPLQDGLLTVQRLRAHERRTPVLILTAHDAVPDRIRGLDAGADDYVVKPVDLHELAARLRSLVRRSNGQVQEQLRWGDVCLDPATRQVFKGDLSVQLSPREFGVLHVLMRNAGRVMTREQIERQLYSWGQEVESNAVEVHIHHLRRKIGNELIITIRGVGYSMRPQGSGPASGGMLAPPLPDTHA